VDLIYFVWNRDLNSHILRFLMEFASIELLETLISIYYAQATSNFSRTCSIELVQIVQEAYFQYDDIFEGYLMFNYND
jgi:hypothetical protein